MCTPIFRFSVPLLLVFILLPLTGFTQSGFHWQVPTNAPMAATIKFDDIYFFDSLHAMTCNGDGKVYKTVNGGFTWELVLVKPDAYFRSVTMTDNQHAWVGNFGKFPGSGISDTNVLYHTTDGGLTWQHVSMPVPYQVGICGLFNLDNQHLYGVGRVGGPAVFIKSVNGGNTWSFKDMSPYCGFIVDCYFSSADTGIAVGGTDSNTAASVPIILKTVNAGTTWDTVYLNTAADTNSWCWKINFPSHQTGYASIENYQGTVVFLKTTDAGNHWVEKPVTNTHFNLQAIGFVNDTVGWAGGYYGNHLYETTDGGDTWTELANVSNLNRLRKINDNVLWGSGKQLYKISRAANGISTPAGAHELTDWTLSKCSRPGCASVHIASWNTGQHYSLSLYDVAGRLIRSQKIGQQDTQVPLDNIANTMIYFVLSDGQEYTSKIYINN